MPDILLIEIYFCFALRKKYLFIEVTILSKISVIVPVYNVERYLQHCVDSILKQTYTDFDLILVDDGSPDNCSIICDKYAEIDDRIVVIHQSNKGLSAARNAGIEWTLDNSDSEWIAFIDSDDWIHPRYLEFLYKAVKNDKTKISICNYVREPQHLENFQDVMDSSKIIQGMKLFESELNVQATVAWNKLYQKELFNDTRYPNGRLHEDEFTTYKLLYLVEKVSWIDEPLYYYYQNVEGIIRSKWNERRLDLYDAYEERVDFFRSKNEQNYYNKELKRLFMAYYEFYVDVVKELKIESKYARKKTRRRLIQSLNKYKDELKQVFTKYDMFSIWALAYGSFFIQKWIVDSEFEPIQSILRRLKQIEVKKL